MTDQQLRDSLKDLSRKQLISIIIQQGNLIEKIQKQIDPLHKRIEELERSSFRQAAPFRISDNKRKLEKKASGRTKGHPGYYRTIDQQQIRETIKVELCRCPYCDTLIDKPNDLEQIIEEIPQLKKEAYRVITQYGYCNKCQKEVYSTHPLQTSTASGAAKVQIGPAAKALAISLQHEYGMTKRKVCKLLERTFELRITPGGLVNFTHKSADKMHPHYESICTNLKQSQVIHSDETSWYVGSPKYWLWVFANADATAYEISASRGRDVIHQMIGKNYSGTLVSDCLGIYDDVNPLQQKCYSHHLKAISQAIDKADDQQKKYLTQLKLLLIAAMGAKELKHEKPPNFYSELCQKLEQHADILLSEHRQDPLEEKVANRLRKQRDHLFTFLYNDQVDATNNLAERQLRPAVIARKVSCGNRTPKGASSWQTLASIAATANQQNQDFRTLVINAIRI